MTESSDKNAGEDLNTQTIELEVMGKALRFDVTRDEYNRYVNAVLPNNKIAPAHNFCIGVINDDSKADLKAVFKAAPGAEVQVAAAVLEEYMPDLEITVKKQKPERMQLVATDTSSSEH